MLDFDHIFYFSSKEPLLFNQYLFLFLFTGMFGFFNLVHRHNRIRNIYLLLCSLFFYYKCSGFYFLLLLFSILVDYVLGFRIHRSYGWKKRFFLILSIFSNLGLLFYFKYAYFMADLLNGVFGFSIQPINVISWWFNEIFQTGMDIDTIILPVGISFYTFQTLSYSIDIYRQKIKPCDSIFDFAFFVSFFPQLVAGPIVRAIDFLPQLKKPYHLTARGFGNAVFLIMAGLVKKVVISDYISVNFVDRVFDTPELYSGFMNLMAIYGYTIQIYCDFSGYSDIAIGLAALMGFTLPINFNSPYKATNITDFWRRWHISLSSWLRDYLYISMGGNRRGKVRTYVHLFITMFLGGLWHGAALKFIIWGSIHGVGLAIHKVWAGLYKSKMKGVGRLFYGVLTFHFVAFAWMYFRAVDIHVVESMISKICFDFDIAGMVPRMVSYAKVFAVIVLGFTFHFIPNNWKNLIRDRYAELPIILQVLVVSVVIFLIYQATSAAIQPFIYFQF